MHTDEYEIALSREVSVCKVQVKRYQRLLDRMETRHGMTTAAFMDRSGIGEFSASPDFSAWRKSVEALQRWIAARDEYERLLGIMKISAS